MDIYSLIFLAGFVLCIGITLAKVYNFMHKGKKFDITISFMLFVVFFISWFVQFVVTLNNPFVAIFRTLIQLSNLLIALNGIFLFIEVILYATNKITGKQAQPYKSNGV